MEIKMTSRAINSQTLLREMDKLIQDGINSVELTWKNEEERSIFVDFLNSLLHEFWNKGDIEQWKVQCNTLNNKLEDMLNGKFILDISFRQRNCLNVSKITYTVQE